MICDTSEAYTMPYKTFWHDLSYYPNAPQGRLAKKNQRKRRKKDRRKKG